MAADGMLYTGKGNVPPLGLARTERIGFSAMRG